ncbi:MAG: putative hydrolase [Actinomycetia bacterium]|nr:putative hydrolase [Actinomycetes bacterium]
MGRHAVSLARVVDRVLHRSPAQMVSRRRNASHLAVLAYHGVSDPNAFARQLDHLVANYRPVSLTDVAAAVEAHSRLPAHAVLVTFDDGDRSVFDTALPLLRVRNIPAVLFVVTALLGTDTPFWWDEVEWLVAHGAESGEIRAGDPAGAVRALKRMPEADRLRAIEELRASSPAPAPPRPQLQPEELLTFVDAGVEIGSHSVTHPILTECGTEQLGDELRASRDRLAAILGVPPIAFAYPNGDRDDRVRSAVHDAGYSLAFLFDHALTLMPPADPLRISRVRVDAHAPLDRFATIVSGLHPAVHRLRGGA